LMSCWPKEREFSMTSSWKWRSWRSLKAEIF
jgi:hypothetical protein